MAFDIMFRQLLPGMGASVSIFVLTLLFSLPLGLLVAFARMSKIKPLQWITKFYISIMRGTPLMLQLLVVYFGPYYVFRQNISTEYRFYATIIGFSINYAAYFAEIYRSGIQSIPVGQREAAKVLGYSRVQTFWKIIFPQMVKRVLPPVTNEVITLVKDTSLARIISAYELTFTGYSFVKAAGITWPLFYTGVFYLIFVGILTLLFNYIERRLDYFR